MWIIEISLMVLAFLSILLLILFIACTVMFLFSNLILEIKDFIKSLKRE